MRAATMFFAYGRGAAVRPTILRVSLSSSPSSSSPSHHARGWRRRGRGCTAEAKRLPSPRALSEEQRPSQHENEEGEVFFEPISEAEAAANERRRLESLELAAANGNDDEDDDAFVGLNDWRWKLDWNEIEEGILVGACPRKPADLDVIASRAGATAVLCLQSDDCFAALGIDHDAIRARGAEIGVKVVRVPIRDFDHGNQSEMMPEATRILSLLIKSGHSVYVHCTAGINRATLCVLSYLTLVEGWPMDDALKRIRQRRPQAHPYLDCWFTARNRLLEGREDELTRRSQANYDRRLVGGEDGSTGDDWFRAETDLIMDTFRNRLTCDLNLVEAWDATQEETLRRLRADLEASRKESRAHEAKAGAADAETARLRANLDAQSAELAACRAELAETKQAVADLHATEIAPMKQRLAQSRGSMKENQRRADNLEQEMRVAHKQVSAMKEALQILHAHLGQASPGPITAAAPTKGMGGARPHPDGPKPAETPAADAPSHSPSPSPSPST